MEPVYPVPGQPVYSPYRPADPAAADPNRGLPITALHLIRPGDRVRATRALGYKEGWTGRVQAVRPPVIFGMPKTFCVVWTADAAGRPLDRHAEYTLWGLLEVLPAARRLPDGAGEVHLQPDGSYL